MAYEIRLPRVFRQSGPMNCWFYAAMTIIFQSTGRLLHEADYLGMSPPPLYPVSTGRGAGVPSWLAFGLGPRQVADFASTFRFLELTYRPRVWDLPNLEKALRTAGPLWFGGSNGSFNHIVVVCGIDSDANVLYGDPATGNLARAPLEVFNRWTRQAFGLPNPLYFPRN